MLGPFFLPRIGLRSHAVLRRLTKPSSFLKQEDWLRANPCDEKLEDAGYLFYLYGKEKGVYGVRAGNPFAMRRREWIERCVTIEDKQTGTLVPFILNEAQRGLEAEILRAERRGEPVRVSVLKARQQGISTYVTALLLWLMLTQEGFRAILMGHKRDSATVLRGRIDKMLSGLRKNPRDGWAIKPRKNMQKEWTLGLPQESSAIIESAEAPDYRGDTMRFFHCIEPAEWPNAEEKANAVWKCIPKAPGTYIIVEGTAHGDTNWYAKTWRNSWRVQHYGDSHLGVPLRALFFPWYIHDRYRWSVVMRRPLPRKLHEEIMNTLDDEERRLLRQRYSRRSVGRVNVDTDQLAWRRLAIAEDCQNMVEFFHQEYPAFPEEAFLSTGMKFYSAKTIADKKEKEVAKGIWRGELVDNEGEAKMTRTLDQVEAFEAQESL